MSRPPDPEIPCSLPAYSEHACISPKNALCRQPRCRSKVEVTGAVSALVSVCAERRLRSKRIAKWIKRVGHIGTSVRRRCVSRTPRKQRWTETAAERRRWATASFLGCDVTCGLAKTPRARHRQLTPMQSSCTFSTPSRMQLIQTTAMWMLL